MRIRTIKPSFWSNDEIAELKPMTRLLFISLWCLADVRGRLEDRPRRIKAEAFPYDNLDVDAALHELAKAGFVIRYKVGDVGVVQVLNFEKHQRINGKESETESSFPQYDENEHGEAVGKQRGSSGEAPGSTGREGKGRDGNGKEGNRADWSAPTTDGEWLESLKRNPAYDGIDVGLQFGRCAQWCEVNKKQNTRRRFINWLNRIDKPINGNHASRNTASGHRKNFTESAPNATARVVELESRPGVDTWADDPPTMDQPGMAEVPV